MVYITLMKRKEHLRNGEKYPFIDHYFILKKQVFRANIV